MTFGLQLTKVTNTHNSKDIRLMFVAKIRLETVIHLIALPCYLPICLASCSYDNCLSRLVKYGLYLHVLLSIASPPARTSRSPPHDRPHQVTTRFWDLTNQTTRHHHHYHEFDEGYFGRFGDHQHALLLWTLF